MADSKIDFSFENLHFACEGDNEWVEKQLNNVLNRIPALLSVHKKNENIVEEVIEVSEEQLVKEETEERMGKPGRSMAEGQATTSNYAGSRGRKAKEGSWAKSERHSKEDEMESSVGKMPAKRGRKPKSAAGVTPKASKAKKVKDKKSILSLDSPIAQFITEKKAVGNQVRKFLATAVFLANSNNITKLSTPMISRALKSYGIEKLQNASDCLNKNEKKGYCIKEGREFVITENGYLSIG